MNKGKWALWLPLLGAVLACNGLNDRPLPTIAPITATLPRPALPPPQQPQL